MSWPHLLCTVHGSATYVMTEFCFHLAIDCLLDHVLTNSLPEEVVASKAHVFNMQESKTSNNML